MGTWLYVDFPYQRYVRNKSHCHLHQHSNMMKIQIRRADLTGNPLSFNFVILVLKIVNLNESGHSSNWKCWCGNGSGSDGANIMVVVLAVIVVGSWRWRLSDVVDISSLLPHALLNLSSLTSLSLSSCQLRGKFPENIFHLPNLQKLELWDNREPNCNIASSLQIINLSRTNFSSQVPDSISNLKALNNVYLIERNFLGSIPAFLGNLNKSPICTSCIIVLAVKSPYRFQTLQSLLTSFLSNNNLNRQLPDSIGNMSQLAFLNLSGNQLTGPIPLYTIGLSRLTYLDLKNNSLNGTIPSWSFTLPSLVSKELRDNKLQGQIPGSVYELVNLTQLSLSSNNLSGIVELYKLLKLKCLSHLDLSYNGLSLSINNSVNSTMPKFYTVGLASCNLSECPNFLRVQAEFLSLDLSNNKIGGEVPKWALDVGEKFIKGFRSF
ncbi:hypothetical protein ACSBR1_012847 [Camellia fascicularis]